MSTALTETGQEPRGTLQWYLDQPAYKNRFENMLGQHRAPQYISSILSLANSNQQFADVEPRSIIASAAIAATLDLPINPAFGYAWIVPYKHDGRKFAQFQMGARGYIQLAYRTGQYQRMNARRISVGAFQGWDEVGEAVIDWGAIDDEKDAVGYAFAFKLTNGFTKIEYWTVNRIHTHALKYSQNHKYHVETLKQKTSYKCRWCTDFDAMAIKTLVANTLKKWGVLSVEMQKAFAGDQAVVYDIDAETVYPDNPEGDVATENGNGSHAEMESESEVKTSKADQMAAKLAAPGEPAARSSASSEEPKEATDESAKEDSSGDGGMAAEDELRATAQALLDKCLATSGKKMTTREKMKTAFKTELVKEVPAAKLGAVIDLLNSILES